MKKLFVLVAIATMTVMGAKAQSDQPRNEIGISYGVSNSMIGDGLGRGLGVGIFEGILGYTWTNNKEFGALGIEYFRHLDNPKMCVGGILTFAQRGEDVEYKDAKIGERTRSYYTVMPAFKYYYINKKSFGLYSKLGAGATLLSSKEEDTKSGKSDTANKLYFAFQASLLGVEFGSQNIRAFFEGGMGEQGIVLAGLKYKF